MLFYILVNQGLTADQAVIYFLITMFVFLVSLTVHEFAHGYVAYKCGDMTPRLSGRLTLNPFKHLDLMGFLSFIILGVGWAKPIPVNPLNFKKFRKGQRLVSVAGVIANFLLGLLNAIFLLILFVVVKNTGINNEFASYLASIFSYFMVINSFLFMFNILPIYPLDGFNFITTFMRAENSYIKFNLRNGVKILLIILLTTSFIEMLTGFDIFYEYLSLLDTLIYSPIAFLGVL